MQTISVRRANELGDAARSAVESLLGRTVADDGGVSGATDTLPPAERPKACQAVTRCSKGRAETYKVAPSSTTRKSVKFG
jgi:hypothetical protein